MGEAKREKGYTLVELLISAVLGLVVVGGAATLMRQGLYVSSSLGQRAEMQQNARAALNLITRDLSLAGMGIPLGGIQLPDGGSAGESRFACDFDDCYVANNVYADRRLHSVRPADGLGPSVEGEATDMLTLVYRDLDSDLDQRELAGIAADGTRIQFDTAVASEVAKLSAGDVVVICNLNGCAAAVVTGFSGTSVSLETGDPLGMNQPLADLGTVRSLADPAPLEGVYPPSRAFRVVVVTYYLESVTSQLMRQVNAHPPATVAENLDDLQFTYDIFDTSTSTATAALPDAGGLSNQIRKANIVLRARSPRRALFESTYQQIALSTSVSTRNLTFRDRYE
ncbi:MAG: PilW family protein [Acidobacteriota bacterium]